MSIDQLTTEAMSLSAEERLTLAHTLLDTVPDQEDEELELDPEYQRELQRRVEELRSGKVVGLSWKEVLAAAERELGCD